MKELVEQILRFARAKAGHVIQLSEPLAVSDVIEEALASEATAIRAARCVVDRDVDPELPLVVGDPAALKQVVQNLISNALKYGANGSNWIGIYAAKTADADAIEIRVADHGAGIPESEKEQIFEPFFRGRRAIEHQIHGSGLGLNLAKKIVEAHGGTISVKSQPMKQTEFIVRIPVAREEDHHELAHSAG